MNQVQSVHHTTLTNQDPGTWPSQYYLIPPSQKQEETEIFRVPDEKGNTAYLISVHQLTNPYKENSPNM